MKFRPVTFCTMLLFLCVWPHMVAAQGQWVITGRITDRDNGEVLLGAFVRVTVSGSDKVVASTEADANGQYTVTLPNYNVDLEILYTGYKPEKITLNFRQQKKRVDVSLAPLTYVLKDLIVRGEKEDFRIRRPDMGLEQITPQTVKKIPLLFGEPDVIKAVQMLPGVAAASEGSSGFLVRGGSPDQNLILFDHATVYNPSHMLGFFSVFNNDAVGDVQLYKGDIPAAYGGRLSSLLDVEGKEGNPDFGLTGGIGLIASRVTVSGPINKNVTYLAAARRTYADMLLRLSNDTTINDATINFYDLNGKMRWRINEKNYLTFTIYNGKDRFGTHGVGFDFGNSTGTLLWNHRFSPRLSLGLSVVGTMYQYDFKGITSALESRWKANIKEAGVRADFNYKWSDRTNTRFGWSGTYQWFKPGLATAVVIEGGTRYTDSVEMSPRQAMLNTLYVSNEHRLFNDRLNLRYGLRITRFDNVGPGTQYMIDENYNVTDTIPIASGDFYHHEYGFEPRVALSYMWNDRMSVKASYSRTIQYVHLLSFSTAGSPLDVWIPANPAIKPQVAQQYALGYFSGFYKNKIQASVEVFYKNLNHVIDFKDHPNILLYDQVESEIRTGTGYSYGAEFMVRKEEGDLTGWLSYTWLRSFRKIDGVNNNKTYSAPADRPHNVSIVLTYQLPFYRRLEASVNWIYSTGQPFVMPEGRSYFFGEFIPIYSARNAYRMPDYHRMDVSLVLRLGKANNKFKNDLNLSVYNVYGRKNPWMINYRLAPDGSQYAEMTYLFSVVPSITWNFSF